MVLSPRDHSPGKVVFPMTQEERLRFLLQALLAERPGGQDLAIPRRPGDRRRLLRALMNTRPPNPIPPEVLAVQDAFLQAELAEKNITRLADLTPGSRGGTSGRGTSPPWRWTPSSTPPTASCWGALSPATGASTMPFLTQSHRGLPGQARSNAAALRISVGFDCL